MNDHPHDLDLIASFAGGFADDDLARRLLDECAVCREEYELQRRMQELLSSLPSPEMTETERQRLHQVLTPPPGARIITLSERRRARTWMRVGTAAAGLLVVVGLGSVFLRMMGGATDGGSLLEAGSAGATTTTLAETFTTAAAAMESFGDGGGGVLSLPGGDEAAVEAEVEQLLEVAVGRANFLVEDTAQRAELRCSDQLTGQTILTAAESYLDGRPIVIYIVEADPELQAVVFDSSTCAEVELR